MSLVSRVVTEWSGGEQLDGPEYEIKYLIETDDPNDGPGIVRDYAGWSYGQVYTYGNETDTRARVSSVSERQVGTSRLHWEVAVKFKDLTEDDEKDPENPLNDALDISWEVEERQELATRDGSGDPILTSSFEQFEDPLYRDDFRRKLVVVRNEAVFNKTVADVLSNGVNNATWNGYAAKSVKLDPIVGKAMYHTLIGQYWQVTYRFSFAQVAGEWKQYRLQEGFFELYDISTTPKRRRIKVREPKVDASGNVTGHKWVNATTRQLLKADGTKLEDNGTPVYKEIEVLKPVNFGLLNMNSLDLS
jgi:hypothetical protein